MDLFKLQRLRITCRSSSKIIVDHIIKNYIQRENNIAVKQKELDICMFCGSMAKITKEHVLPRWTFDNCSKRFFKTNINGITQHYNKTTIPACAICNNDILASLEKYIIKIFAEVDLNYSHFSYEELQNIIRWLEIIDYKFQVLDNRRKFQKSAVAGYIPYLADFPLSMLRMDKEYTIYSVITELRRSQKRITIKNKAKHVNSLIIFKTRNSDFHFFYEMDDFIFIELSTYGISIFYFYKATFEKIEDAYNEAMKLINKYYG